MRILRIFLVFQLLTPISTAWATDLVRLEGTLQERGTRKSLAGVNVYVLPSGLKAVTDNEGHFLLENVPEGEFRWTVRLSGYENLDQNDAQKASEPSASRRLFIEKENYATYETTVQARVEKRDDKTQTLEAEDFHTAGTGNDPIKAVQNLPGSITPSYFTPAILVEGSAPEDTRYTIEGYRVPTIFHFGGFSTVIQSEAVDRVDFLSAGYGPEYGQALGGYVNAWTLSPSRDRLQGFGFLDDFNVGGLVQGPLGEKSSFLFAARTGYVGAVVTTFSQQNSLFTLTTTPTFSDGALVYQTELSPTDSLKIVNVGSYDLLGLTLNGKHPQAISQSNGFFRLIPEFTHRAGDGTFTRISLGSGVDSIFFQNPLFYYRYNATFLSARAEVEKLITRDWKGVFGVETTLTWPVTNFVLPTISAVPLAQGRSTYTTWAGALYWRNTLHFEGSPWTWTPAVRADYYNPTQELIPEPRLAVRYALSDGLALRTAFGLYTQAPADQQLDPSYGNPTLKSELAWHATLGAEKDFRQGSTRGVQLSGDVFYKYFQQLIVPSTRVGEHFNNTGYGNAYGAELLLKLNFDPFQGWAGYMLSRSTRGSAVAAEGLYGYDQTHSLTLLAGYALPHHWKVSGRTRVMSASPSTPIIGGVVDDIYLPAPGSFLSQRLPAPPIFQLDLRVDKRWIYERWILSFYLDVQNVTFSPSSDGSFDLPFVPTVGLKGEF